MKLVDVMWKHLITCNVMTSEDACAKNMSLETSVIHANLVTQGIQIVILVLFNTLDSTFLLAARLVPAMKWEVKARFAT